MASRSVVIDMEFRNRQAKNALQGVESGLTDVRVAADKAGSKARSSAQALGSGFTRASGNVKGTGAAVTNLSRIIQDAPFGTIGVANNIEPFISSFQSLKTQVGSTKGAFMTLLSSAFTGPGALITIVSLVTSALTAISLGILDVGDEAEDTLKELDGLISNFEQVIDLRDQFGEFDDDEFGLEKMQAEISEITEDIDRQRGVLQRLNELEEQRTAIVKARPDPTTRTEEQRRQLRQIEQEKGLYADIETVEGGIKDLEQQRLQLLIDIKNTADALSDEDVKRAQAAQANTDQKKEEKEEATELKDLTSDIKSNEERINQLLHKRGPLTEAERAELVVLKEQNSQLEQQIQYRQQLGSLIGPAPQRPDDSPIPAGPLDIGSGGQGPAQGSIDALRAQMQQLQEIYNMTPFADSRLQIAEQIKDLRAEIERLEDPLQQTGKAAGKSFEVLQKGAGIAANAIAQIALRGAEAHDIIKDLAIRLASQAIVTALTAAATDGASLGGKSFIGAVLGGFAGGTDARFPGIGRVGERGEELLVAPPMSTIITNENVQRMDQMQREARTGADNIMGMGAGNLVAQLRQAIIEGNQLSPAPVVQYRRFDEGLKDDRSIETAIGNEV